MDTQEHTGTGGGAFVTSCNGDAGQAVADPGKMFIGGLSWQTSTEGLKDYFGQFGDISDGMVMKDPMTKRSRGFGFVSYTDPDSVEKVLASGPHTLDSKVVDPKVAVPRPKNAEIPMKGSIIEYSSTQKMVTRTKKIFIGGLAATSTEDDVRTYFEQFGKVADAMLMFDKVTQRHRGFAFVTFENEDAVDKVIAQHFHEINNKLVECKKAQPKEVMLTQGLARGIVPIGLQGLPQTYYIGGRGVQIAGLPYYYHHPATVPTYGYLPTAGGVLPTADRVPSSYYTMGGDFGASGTLTASQMAAAMGHVMALPATYETVSSPIHREQYIIQRTVQSAGLPSRRGLLALQDYAGTDIMLNGYGSSFTCPTSPIASPTSTGLYCPGGLSALGYVQTTSPPQSVSAYAISANYQNGYH